MLKHPDYTRARVAETARRLRALVYAARVAPDELLVSSCVDRITWREAQELEYRPAAMGERFGPLWATYWFRLAATVPEAWAGRRVDLLWETHSEATLWLDGRSAQGLNSGPGVIYGANAFTIRGIRPDAILTSEARGGERLEAQVEVACNSEFGALPQQYATGQGAVLDVAAIALFDEEAWRLLCDLEVLAELEADIANGLDESWAGELLAELNRFCNVWRDDDRETWPAAQAILRALLERRNGSRVHEVHAIGHAHIDTAWLWPIAETHRKVVRSWSSQVEYMARYPEYRFACSQAQQYAWVRDENPDLWRLVCEQVERGSWLPVGGTWIEPDCNLPSGESLARQFLLGQRFFEQTFGRRCTEFWNPDVFGYNGQLPQIMRGAGIQRFLTQKLSWNAFNQPPHHTFTWRGIDGSEVLAHFPPADTYCGVATVGELRFAARNYKDHDRSRHSMYLFGYGDGGGGPTPAMIERIRRAEDLQGVPRTRFSTSEEFFAALEADCDDRVTVVGELYFEFHRGTYTTQAAVKRANRRGEVLLHEAEFVAAIADRLGLTPYPSAELDEAWKLLLCNQFHDILPGSSIAEVYVDAARDLARVAALAGEIRDTRLAVLAGAVRRPVAVGPGSGGGDAPDAGALNALAFARREVVETTDGRVALVASAPYGFGGAVEPADEVTVEERDDAFVLENGTLRAEIGRDGTVRSLVHLPTGREALAAPGNVLRLYDDHPSAWDAWDVDPFHLETGEDCPPAESCELVLASPLRAELRFERAVGAASRVRQVVRLDAEARRLEFHTEVDWHESHRFLKAAFPAAVHAARATYEMQFGVVERPTHFSTNHDLARFEVPGHRFADLSEHGFGVALLTDSTYGYSCLDNELRLSLLRAPKWPDENADMGTHTFAYAVMPHDGGWQDAGVVGEAARFNAPLRVLPTPVPAESFASVDDAALVLDTIKRSEDGGGLVLRLYEAHGGRGVARVRLGVPFTAAARSNLLEDDGEPLAVDGEEIVVPYGPFEIVTVRVR